MLFSREKTKFINFNLRINVHFSGPIYYTCTKCLVKQALCAVDCQIIQRVNYIKYLGIFLDREVNWEIHIAKLKLKSTLNWVLMYFYFLRDTCPENILRSLYFSLVESRLEYGLICWGGNYL
jgi:hypothetical protein